MHPYLIVSMAIFLLLGIIWNRKDILNLLFKLLFLGLAVWGVYLIAHLP